MEKDKNAFPFARYWPMNAAGHLINDTHPAKLPEIARAIFPKLKTFLLNEFPGQIESIYLRGSAAWGGFNPAHADLDFFVLTSLPNHRWEAPLGLQDFLNHHSNQYKLNIECPFATACKDGKDWMIERPFLAAQIKCFSILLHGEDHASSIPPFGLGKYLAPNKRWYLKDWQNFQLADPSPTVLSAFCKMSLRTAFELIMPQVGKYTNALQLCEVEISRHFPDQEADAQAVLQLFLEPSKYRGRVKDSANDFWAWLAFEVEQDERS